jgi:gamma-glutamylcyclotransferase (GGCT)/AIG2-like uncharacterized protein YtfP
MKCYVFAYGTLCNANVRKQVLGYDPPAFSCEVKGFRLEKIQLETEEYPILVENSGCTGTIQGSFFEVDEEDLLLLDAYETNAYRRKKTKLSNGIKSWVYYK